MSGVEVVAQDSGPPRSVQSAHASFSGAFEVEINGELVFSKLGEGEFPDFDQVSSVCCTGQHSYFVGSK